MVTPETPVETEQPQTIYLIECTGNPNKGNPRGHSYKAKTADQLDTPNSLGWMTLDEAKSKFGPENLKFSGTSALCDTCIG